MSPASIGRRMLLVLVLTGALAAPAAAATVDLERVTVAQLQERMDGGDLTSVALTKAYLDRIAALNANLAAGKAANRAAIDDALAANDLDAIMTPAQTLIVIGARAGYPQLTVPAGYDLDATKTFNPVNVSFTGTAYSDADLLAFGYAYEQATNLRLPPSFTNPSLWRCVPGSAVAPHSCAP